VQNPLPMSLARQLVVSDSVVCQGQTASIAVLLKAQGNENALGFSLSFDPANLTYKGSRLGSAVSNGSLNLNTNQISSGRLACVLALPSGATFAAGTREVLVITLSASATAPTSPSNQLSFADQPVPCEIADTTATVLSSRYINGTVTIIAPPTLRIAQIGTNITLAWPQLATGFNLQESPDAFGLNEWSNLLANPVQVNGENLLTLPIKSSARFYRLYHP